MRKIEELALGLADLLGEAAVEVEAVEPDIGLAGDQPDDARQAGMGRIVFMRDVDAQRAAMAPQFLDVEDSQAVRGEDALRRAQREIREMLVVDRVELVLGDEPHEMRKLDRRDAPRREQGGDAGDEGIDVGHLRQHIVGDDEVGGLAGGAQTPPGRLVEEPDQGLDAASPRRPWRHWRRGRCRAPECRAARRIAGDSRHCSRARRRGSAGPSRSRAVIIST